MPGLAHLYIGEEAVAVGVCEALRPDDYITSTHRGHGHCLAKGAAPDRMFAELLGKEAGYCKGKGGSMHIADPATGNLGANAIVGGQRGHRHRRGVFGEASGHRASRGVLLRRRRAGPGRALRSDEHGRAVEAAGDLRLRKQYVQRVHALFGDHGGRYSGARRRRSACTAESVDGQDVRAVYATTAKLVERARRGRGSGVSAGATPIAITGITSAISAANIIAPSRKSSSGRRSAIRFRFIARLADRAEAVPMQRRDSGARSKPKCKLRWRRPCSSRWPRRIRMRRK